MPAIFNGMATGADWMSAASFIGLAGTLFSGYQGLACVMGWTGGYVLVALLRPYLRRFGNSPIPDFLAARYGGNGARFVGVFATVLASFVYVVAQIYGVGLIASRFVGPVRDRRFLGLAGILVCSFLGGMKAVTWTQVAQYDPHRCLRHAGGDAVDQGDQFRCRRLSYWEVLERVGRLWSHRFSTRRPKCRRGNATRSVPMPWRCASTPCRLR